jgi:hypothetical protein
MTFIEVAGDCFFEIEWGNHGFGRWRAACRTQGGDFGMDCLEFFDVATDEYHLGAASRALEG